MANRIKRNSNVLPTKIEVVSHSIDENGIKNLPNGETPIFSPEIPKTNEESSKFAPSNFLKRDQSLPQSMYDLDKSYSSNFLYQLEAYQMWDIGVLIFIFCMVLYYELQSSSEFLKKFVALVILMDILSIVRMALFDLNKIVQSLKRQDKLWSGLEPYMLDFSILVLLFGSLVMSIQEFIVMDSRNTQISWSSFVGLLATITKSVYSLYVVLTTIKQ